MCANEVKEFPPMPKPVQAYQWIGCDGGWKVGTQAIDVKGVAIDFGDELWLMKHSHTGELEWVEPGELSLYPPNNVKIEEPTK